MRVLVVLSLLFFSNLPSAFAFETNCAKTDDIVCHLGIFIYCIDTTSKEITHGANLAKTPQQPLAGPENPTSNPNFVGSLQTKLEITGAEYGGPPGSVTVYYLTLRKLPGTSKKIVGKISVTGSKEEDLDCHFNN